MIKLATVFFVSFALFWISDSSQAKGRQSAIGYFRIDHQKRLYFVERPGELVSGVRAFLRSPSKIKDLCVLKSVNPVDCPRQKITYVPTQKFGRPALTRVEVSQVDSSAWRRLQVAEEIFVHPLQKTKKSK